MRKFRFLNIVTLLAMVIGLAACSKDDIVFEHEKPQFPEKEGQYLLEVIMPEGTGVDDDIYIVGPFNGGDAEAVAGDLRWQLTKCEANNIKWGIYINPADLRDGATLTDGYTFYNTTQGMERSLTDEPVLHTEVPALGGRINVTVNRWASFFETPVDPGEVEHDGYAIYVNDKTSWGALAMYAWGDGLPELFGSWPGITPTGTINIGGVDYKYFDTGAANEGLTYNIIFNNNNGGTQIDGPAVTLDKDYYFTIDDNGWTEGGGEPAVTHDGYAIFVHNLSDWEALAMYAWSDGLPELFGGWPGISPTGTQTINGVTYDYFDTGAANEGLFYNFILNNNNGGKQVDLCGVTLDKDYYYLWDGTTARELDPENPDVGPVEPDPDPETHPHSIFVNNTLSWGESALYVWGDSELFGGWPGKYPDSTEEIDGASYLRFDYEGAGETINLIINDGGQGQQVDGPAVTADRDYYFMVTADGWTEVNPDVAQDMK